MPRPKRSSEFEAKLLELILSTCSIADIAEKLGKSRGTISSALGPIYAKYGIEGDGAGKRYRLLARLRPLTYSARHAPIEGKFASEKKDSSPRLDKMGWEDRFWVAYGAICKMEQRLEDDGNGGNRYWQREA